MLSIRFIVFVIVVGFLGCFLIGILVFMARKGRRPTFESYSRENDSVPNNLT